MKQFCEYNEQARLSGSPQDVTSGVCLEASKLQKLGLEQNRHWIRASWTLIVLRGGCVGPGAG